MGIRRFLSPLLLCLLCWGSGLCQEMTIVPVGSIKTQDGTPLEGAEVILTDQNGTTHKVLADGVGKFRFKMVPPGTYVAKVVYKGKVLAEKKPFALSLGQASSLDFVFESVPVGTLDPKKDLKDTGGSSGTSGKGTPPETDLPMVAREIRGSDRKTFLSQVRLLQPKGYRLQTVTPLDYGRSMLVFSNEGATEETKIDALPQNGGWTSEALERTIQALFPDKRFLGIHRIDERFFLLVVADAH